MTTWIRTNGTNSWQTNANWFPANDPDSSTAIANFITTATDIQTVTVSGGGTKTVNQLNIANLGFQITFSAGILEFAGTTPKLTSSNATVNITSTIVLTSNTEFNISSGCIVTVTNNITGNSSLTVTGGGKLILTNNNNTYLSTIINSGTTVQLGVGSNGNFGTATVNCGGTILLNRSSGNQPLTSNINVVTSATIANISGTVAQILSGIIGGASTLDIGTSTATGTIVLTGTNTFVNTIRIQYGVLQIGNNSLTGSINLVTSIENYTSFVISRTGTITISASISQSGTLSKLSSGTCILTGSNTFSGSTTISSGTLQIGNAGASGTLSGTSSITNNSALTISRTGSITISAPISGTGTLSNVSSGTCILTGSNTFSGSTTISSGTLQIGNAGATGTLSNTSSIINTAALVVSRTGTITISAPISGSGGTLSNISSGTLILTGISTYTGATTVSSGTLQINTPGSITSTTTATNSKIQGISGKYGSINLNSGSTFQSGDDTTIGTLLVTGVLTFNTGSAYKWKINGNSSSNANFGIVYDGCNITGSLVITPTSGPVLNVFMFNPSVNLANVFWDTGNVSTHQFWDVLRSTIAGANTGILAATNTTGSVTYTGGGVIYKPAYGYFVTNRVTTVNMNNGLQIQWNWLSSTCIHPDMNIITDNGIKKVKDLSNDDKLLTIKGEYVDVKDMVTNICKKRVFIKCEKDCFNKNIPDEDLYLTSGHKVLYNDNSIRIHDLINGTTIKRHKEVNTTISIITQNGDFVIVNNTPVSTFNLEEWKHHLCMQNEPLVANS